MHGHVDARFERVREEFTANLWRGELGAGCAVVVDGQVVVDLWGGWADLARTREWEQDTVVNAYSVGKPLAALQLLQLVASGHVALDDPVARWWPELRAGQEGATVRHVLSHRAGLPAIRQPLSDDDLWHWDAMCSALAVTDPWWPPGTRHAYHSNTYGFLVGELARRISGEMPGDWLRLHVAGPLGADVCWGVRGADLRRCADIAWQGPVPPPDYASAATLAGLTEEEAMIRLGYFNPPGLSGVGVVNTEAWRRAQVPSTNLHATAKGVALVYAALVAGSGSGSATLLDPDTLAEATRVQSEGWCPVLEREVSFGLGFQPTRADRPFGPNPRSYGHFGSGGALGFADPDAHLAFGYVMNAVRPRWQSEHNRALVDAVYACI